VTFDHRGNDNQVTLEVYGDTDLERGEGVPVKFDPTSGKLEFRYFVTDDDEYFRGQVTPDSLTGSFSDTFSSEILPRVSRGASPPPCERSAPLP
jgi:hypothetical protein